MSMRTRTYLVCDWCESEEFHPATDDAVDEASLRRMAIDEGFWYRGKWSVLSEGSIFDICLGCVLLADPGDKDWRAIAPTVKRFRKRHPPPVSK